MTGKRVSLRREKTDISDAVRTKGSITRRQFCRLMAGCAAWPLLGQATVSDQTRRIHMRAIPSSGEHVPLIGMGSYVTFDIGDSIDQLARRTRVLQAFFAAGGTLIDSSPMYDRSEATLGKAIAQLAQPPKLFSATKVWHWFTDAGDRQMSESRDLWGRPGFDLMQVHNLVNWYDHLQTIRRDQDTGLVRYVGITTSHGRMHKEMLDIMRREPLDFVQFTYNILDREAEQRLLPSAADKGIAVIINRPFRRKGLIRQFESHPLPPWATDIGCATWAQFLLKFAASHPAVTCVIPATSRADHMRENMAVLSGELPDAKTRQAMVRYVSRL